MKLKKQKKLAGLLSLSLVIVFAFSACNSPNKKQSSNELTMVHADWTKNVNIYEVNIRQYTPEGTLNAFMEHLPRLKKMGVDILWIMPIHPIGEKNRKGNLGSYYAVKDYKAVNPEFGSMEDFKKLVDKAHEMRMYVILDWVANHSAWDNPWIFENPEWYLQDSTGNIIPPVADWSDVAGLNYTNKNMRLAMIDALKFWISEANIDGYRCDVAGMVPTDFWEDARKELLKLNPELFMLAEADKPEHHHFAFDMSYAWPMHFLLNEIAQGKKPLEELDKQLAKEKAEYPSDAYLMNFTSNHDENSWKGNAVKRLGNALEPMAVFTLTTRGMPLIYSGQEACMDKDLRFFDKDTINWKDCDIAKVYTKLLHLKKTNKALWNGDFGGDMLRIKTSADDQVYAFVRKKDKDQVITVINMSDKEADFMFNDFDTKAELVEVFTNETPNFKNKMKLKAWGYKVFATK